MSRFILPLSASDATLESVGGKGMSLAKLSRAGLPVPGGFHITTDAYRLFVSENGLQPRILGALKGVHTNRPASMDSASEEITRLFTMGQIPPDVAREILESYAELSNHQSSVWNATNTGYGRQGEAEGVLADR